MILQTRLQPLGDQMDNKSGTTGATGGRISESSIQELMDIGIRQVYRTLYPSLNIKENGNCPCPLTSHQGENKTPSFTMDNAKNVFYCHSEGIGGSNLQLAADAFGMDPKRDFREVIERLANVMGQTLHYEARDAKEGAREQERAAAFRATSFTQKMYKHALSRLFDQKEKLEAEGVPFEKWPEPVQTLDQRKITRDFADKNSIGYAPTDNQYLYKLLTAEGPDAVKAGFAAAVISKNKDSGRPYDTQINRITYACEDYKSGAITGFTGRIASSTSSAPKYKNTSNDSIIYDKKSASSMYGLYSAINRSAPEWYSSPGTLKAILVVEGPNDVCSAQRAGVPAVCANGTAVSENQLKTLFRFCNELIFAFDVDLAGNKASEKTWLNALPLSEGKIISQVQLPDSAKDIGAMFPEEIRVSIHKRFGPAKAIANAVKLHMSHGKLVSGTQNTKNELLELATKFLKAMPEGLSKATACGQLSSVTGIPDHLMYAATTFTRNDRPVKDHGLGNIMPELAEIDAVVTIREAYSKLQIEHDLLKRSIVELKTAPYVPKPIDPAIADRELEPRQKVQVMPRIPYL
jgi:DNA primase